MKTYRSVLDIDFNFNDLETSFLEISLRNRKRLCVGLYKPPNQNKQYLFHYNDISLNSVPSLIFCRDFNLTTENWNLDTFISSFDLKSHLLTLF